MSPISLLLAILTTSLAGLTCLASTSNSNSNSNDEYAIWATPHASYSSSIGVPGCKINTDRVAYFPSPPSCSSICVLLTYQSRSLPLLRIDSSQGAHDISYDAFNTLLTGYPATQRPVASGPVAMTAQDVDPSRCAPLIHTDGHKLPLSAANSINFLASCLADNSSWVASNHVLYNIDDSWCTLGYDEVCQLDWPEENQPKCAHTLGLQTPLKGKPVYDVLYPSGERALAGTSVDIPSSAGYLDSGSSTTDQQKPSHSSRLWGGALLRLSSVLLSCLIAI